MQIYPLVDDNGKDIPLPEVEILEGNLDLDSSDIVVPSTIREVRGWVDIEFYNHSLPDSLKVIHGDLFDYGKSKIYPLPSGLIVLGQHLS